MSVWNEPTIYNSPIHAAWKLADATDVGEELMYEKELIYAGDFEGNGVRFSVDESLLLHWLGTFNEMRSNGIKVPLPIEHTTDPEASRGEVVSMSVRPNQNGIPALFVFAQFRDAEAVKLAQTTDVSLYSPPEFTDGKGRRYVRPIRHVALTDYPVIPGLQSFEAISASLVIPKEDTTMPMTDLLSKLNLEVEDEAQAEEAIAARFAELEAAATSHAEVVAAKDEEIEALKAKIPSDPLPVAASHRTLLRDNRTMKLDKLVGEKISPATKDALIELFCSDDSLNLVLSHENGDDKFDKVIEILESNEVVQLSSSTPPQGAVPLSKNDVNDPTKNPVLAEAQKRAEAAKK